MPIGPLMLDIASTQLTQQDKALISNPLCGGLILFSRNFVDAQQIEALNNEIRSLNPDIIIAVDQEGGRVQRFKDGFTILPPLRAIGDYYQRQPDKALEIAHVCGELMAREVQSVGCDISFAPVLDLGLDSSKVIGDRAFSTDPELISLLGAAYITGMKMGGMAATGKHFPGHGSVVADSHFDLPIDEREWSLIQQLDLQPFINLNKQLAAVMPAHIVYQDVDTQPAGFSSVWLRDILRGQIGFEGVIFSDDLSMKGAEVIGSFAQRAEAALTAGCDMVLVCNNRKASLEVLNTLENFSLDSNSSERLSRLKMQNKPCGLDALKETSRWRELSESLARFERARESANGVE